jgi:hypothetical protein
MQPERASTGYKWGFLQMGHPPKPWVSIRKWSNVGLGVPLFRKQPPYQQLEKLISKKKRSFLVGFGEGAAWIHVAKELLKNLPIT